MLPTLYAYRAHVDRIVDGDTIDLTIDLGFKVTLSLRFRLYGVNAPEIFSTKTDSPEHVKGAAAKKFVEDQLANLSVVYIKTYKDAQEKYGRYLCDVAYIDAGGVEHDLATEMVAAGHAVKVDYK